jgi:DNA-binding NarL/FixJ family response regulator
LTAKDDEGTLGFRPMTRPRVLVLSRSRRIEDALERSVLAGLFELVAHRSPQDLSAHDRRQRPHVMIVDRPALDPTALMMVGKLAQDWAGVPLLVVTEHATDREVLAALRAGATGCLFREDLERRLVPAIHEALEGGAPMSRAVANMVLTRARRHSSAQMKAVRKEPEPSPALGERKREIIAMLARGLSYDQIGLALDISINTVRSHVREIYETLEVSTKVEAVMAAVERGIIR